MDQEKPASLATEKEQYRTFVKHRRKFAVILFSLVLLIVYNFYSKTFNTSATSFQGDNFQFFVLKQVNILLISVLSAILIRYAIKLIFERQKKQLGFRLKTKFILIFLSIGVLPILFFFYLNTDFLHSKFLTWLDPKASTTIDKAISFLQNVKSKQEQNLREAPAQMLPSLKTLREDQWNLIPLPWTKANNFVSGLVIYDNQGNILKHFKNPARLSTSWEALPAATTRKIPNPPLSFEKDGMVRQVYPFTTNRKQKLALEVYADNKVLPQEDSSFLLSDLYPLKKSLGLAENLNSASQVNLVLFPSLIILAFLWVAIYISRKLLNPISKLIDGVEELKQGNFDTRVEVASHDELKILAENFNSMVVQLKSNASALEQKETLLRKANQDLATQNVTLQSIFGSMRSGALMITPTGSVENVNQAFLNLLGKEDFPLGEKLQSLLPASLHSLISSLQQEVEEKNLLFTSVESSLNFSGSNEHYKIDLYRILSPHKQPLGFLVLLESLDELDKLLKAKAWQEVARRIAHEIKNPLTPIKISAERLKKLPFDRETAETVKIQTIANVILSEVETLKTMIDEFSTFARTPEASLQNNHLLSTVERAINACLSYKPANIEIQLEVQHDPGQFLFDAELIKRALYNLIDNAITAIGEQPEGKIILRVDQDKASKQAIISIEDNGPGIEAEILKKLFEPYNTTKSKGTGLGLAIVRRIVYDHGGKITIDSSSSKTLFTIFLPIV